MRVFIYECVVVFHYIGVNYYFFFFVGMFRTVLFYRNNE